jgi:hypothetical protein
MRNVSSSACRRIASPRRFIRRLLLSALTITCIFATTSEAAPLPTRTTLMLSSSSVAWSVSKPTEVTLTASVTGSPAPSAGTVTFCKASAALCEDAAIFLRSLHGPPQQCGQALIVSCAYGGFWLTSRELAGRPVKSVDEVLARVEAILRNDANVPAYTAVASIRKATVGW